MTSPSYPDLLAAIRTESAAFRSTLADCDPEARVPACPDWNAGDLLWHLAEVQLFWATVVEERPSSPREDRQVPDRPASYVDLLDFFDQSSGRMIEAFVAADPAETAWHWSMVQTVGTSYRRQAHEALIHRVDAEQTAAVEMSPLPAELAADGVLECLELMYGGDAPDWARFEPGPGFLEVRVTDLERSIWTRPGLLFGTDPDSGINYDGPHVHVVSGPADGPQATISGTAADLDVWLWSRGDEASISTTGDDSTLAAFRDAITPDLD